MLPVHVMYLTIRQGLDHVLHHNPHAFDQHGLDLDNKHVTALMMQHM
jgi:hypothetical protein